MTVRLDAPPSYLQASDSDRSRVANGCGPGGWKYDLIPDAILGVRIAEACDIHDWMYDEGDTWADKAHADEVFLRNMRTIIRARGGVLVWARLFLARVYYRAVVRFGDRAFLTGKVELVGTYPWAYRAARGVSGSNKRRELG